MVISLFLLSCDKDNDHNNDNDNVPDIPDNGDTLPPGGINMGDTLDMLVFYYDTLLVGKYNSPQYFNLDMDNNGVDDIQFMSKLHGSPGGGVSPKSTIQSINPNVQIFGYHKPDTLFKNTQTTIEDGENDDPVEVITTIRYTCHQISNADEIVSIIPSYKLEILEKGDFLDEESTFKADDIIMIEGSRTSGDANYGSDTTFVIIEQYYYDCNAFPLEEEVYIGIKFADESRLGWIRVSLVAKHKIHIIESALQKITDN